MNILIVFLISRHICLFNPSGNGYTTSNAAFGELEPSHVENDMKD